MTLNQALGFKLGISIRHRRAVNAEHGGKLTASRNAVAGTQIACVHEGAQLIAKLDVQRNVTLRLEMKWQHCLSPSANSTRYWTAARANLSSSSLAGWPAQRCTWQHVRERGRYPNADWTRSGLEPNKPTAPVRTCRELGSGHSKRS